jgi:hypothetical protein
MSFFAYNHVYIQILEEALEEFIILYYNAKAEYNQFITLVELSALLDKKFLVGAPNKLYVETVAHIYWVIRIIADPDKDTMEMRNYIRTFNPFFEIEELFTKAIADYNLQAQQHMEQIERDEVQQFLAHGEQLQAQYNAAHNEAVPYDDDAFQEDLIAEELLREKLKAFENKYSF